MKTLLRIVGWLMRQLEKTNTLPDDAILLHWCHKYVAHGLEIPPFIGMDALHVVTTQAATGIQETQATGNGSIDASPNAPDATERGFVYTPSINGTPELGPSDNVFETGTFAQNSGAFSINITGLTASTEYNVRAYAINSVGTAYGETVTFTTTAAAVTYTITSAPLTALSATVAADVDYTPPPVAITSAPLVALSAVVAGTMAFTTNHSIDAPLTAPSATIEATASFAEAPSGSFPTIRASNVTSFATPSLGGTVVLPTGHAEGDLLIIGVCIDRGVNLTAPEGWTLLAYPTNTTQNTHVVWYKIRGATESNPAITWDTSEDGNAYAIAITAGTWSGTPEIATAYGSDATPDAPSLTPSWGAANTLWFALHSWDLAHVSSSDPTDYTLLTYSTSGGIGTRTHYREINAASQDPSAITIAFDDTWYAHTLAVQPAAATATFTIDGTFTALTATASGTLDYNYNPEITANLTALSATLTADISYVVPVVTIDSPLTALSATLSGDLDYNYDPVINSNLTALSATLSGALSTVAGSRFIDSSLTALSASVSGTIEYVSAPIEINASITALTTIVNGTISNTPLFIVNSSLNALPAFIEGNISFVGTEEITINGNLIALSPTITGTTSFTENFNITSNLNALLSTLEGTVSFNEEPIKFINGNLIALVPIISSSLYFILEDDSILKPIKGYTNDLVSGTTVRTGIASTIEKINGITTLKYGNGTTSDIVKVIH